MKRLLIALLLLTASSYAQFCDAPANTISGDPSNTVLNIVNNSAWGIGNSQTPLYATSPSDFQTAQAQNAGTYPIISLTEHDVYGRRLACGYSTWAVWNHNSLEDGGAYYWGAANASVRNNGSTLLHDGEFGYTYNCNNHNTAYVDLFSQTCTAVLPVSFTSSNPSILSFSTGADDYCANSQNLFYEMTPHAVGAVNVTITLNGMSVVVPVQIWYSCTQPKAPGAADDPQIFITT